MNNYDQEALHAIQAYRFRCGGYPTCVEVPGLYLERMVEREFIFAKAGTTELIHVPAVPISGPPPDIVFKQLFIEEMSHTSMQEAEDRAIAHVQRYRKH